MQDERKAFAEGRLVIKQERERLRSTIAAGVHQMGLDSKRDGLIYIPPNYDPLKPVPLAVMLHGAGGDAHHGMSLIRHLADEANIILLAPMSRGGSWDIITYNSFGPDIAFINTAICNALGAFNIDTSKMAIGGFSDGASYALSVGLSNGDVFSHIIAFSPGFYYTVNTHGNPQVFISHGTSDNVLPIGPCSRRIIPKLEKKGYNVNYHEFDGPHIIPSNISLEAVKWFLK